MSLENDKRRSYIYTTVIGNHKRSIEMCQSIDLGWPSNVTWWSISKCRKFLKYSRDESNDKQTWQAVYSSAKH